MGNQCCAGEVKLNEYDLLSKQSPERRRRDSDPKKIDLSNQSTAHLSFSNSTYEPGQSFISSTENNKLKFQTNQQNTNLPPLKPLSRRRQGSKLRKASEILDDSPQIKLNHDHHLSSIEVKDVASIDLGSDLTQIRKLELQNEKKKRNSNFQLSSYNSFIIDSKDQIEQSHSQRRRKTQNEYQGESSNLKSIDDENFRIFISIDELRGKKGSSITTDRKLRNCSNIATDRQLRNQAGENQITDRVLQPQGDEDQDEEQNESPMIWDYCRSQEFNNLDSIKSIDVTMKSHEKQNSAEGEIEKLKIDFNPSYENLHYIQSNSRSQLVSLDRSQSNQELEYSGQVQEQELLFQEINFDNLVPQDNSQDQKEKNNKIFELQKSIFDMEKQLIQLQISQRNQIEPLEDVNTQEIQNQNNSFCSNNQQKEEIAGPIFNITERNEESEITGGTCSILSNILRVDNDEMFKSQLNRLSLLSRNFNLSQELHFLSNEDAASSQNKLKMSCNASMKE